MYTVEPINSVSVSMWTHRVPCEINPHQLRTADLGKDYTRHRQKKSRRPAEVFLGCLFYIAFALCLQTYARTVTSLFGFLFFRLFPVRYPRSRCHYTLFSSSSAFFASSFFDHVLFLLASSSLDSVCVGSVPLVYNMLRSM